MNRKQRKQKRKYATDYSKGNGCKERRMKRYINRNLISYKGEANAN